VYQMTVQLRHFEHRMCGRVSVVFRDVAMTFTGKLPKGSSAEPAAADLDWQVERFMSPNTSPNVELHSTRKVTRTGFFFDTKSGRSWCALTLPTGQSCWRRARRRYCSTATPSLTNCYPSELLSVGSSAWSSRSRMSRFLAPNCSRTAKV